MGWLERRLQAVNPYASNPGIADRDKAARKQQREAREAADRRARHRAELRGGGGKKPRWPW